MRMRAPAMAMMAFILAGCGLIADARIVCTDVPREDCTRAVEAVRAAGGDVAEAIEVSVRAGCYSSCPPPAANRTVTVTLAFGTGSEAVYHVDILDWTVAALDF